MRRLPSTLLIVTLLLMSIGGLGFVAYALIFPGAVSFSSNASVQVSPCSLLTSAEVEPLVGRLARAPSATFSYWRNCYYETGRDELDGSSLLVGVTDYPTAKAVDATLEDMAEFSGVAVDRKQWVANLGRRAIYRVAKANRDYNAAPHDTVEFYVTDRTYLLRIELVAFGRPAEVAAVQSLVEKALARLP